jgi:phospholipid/cholesterol/gamma-HCH transport system substrate-binding protein
VSRHLSRVQALWLGLVVLLGLALGVFGLFVVGSRVWPSRDDLQVQVGFPEIRGVEVGTRVRIQGMDAGEVQTISPPSSTDAPVLLNLRIKGSFRHLVRVSSTVQIVSEGMLGGKVIEIRPPVTRPGQSPPNLELASNGTMLAGEPSQELADVLNQVGDTLRGLQDGKGTLGKLVKDPQAYEALLALLRSGNEAVLKSQDTMSSIQRDADALKKVPIIGGYIEDPVALLVRPNCERNRRIFAEGELFEPGRAVLTAPGKEKLDDLSGWLDGLKHKGSEVVIVSYADPKKSDSRPAQEVTRQQSDAIVAYLKGNHKIHKMGWFTSRKVIPLGMGTQPPPQMERDVLPSARIEVVVFVPQT